MLFSVFRSTKYSFEGKKDYENVLLLLYRHWFILFIRLLSFLLLALLPIALSYFFGFYINSLGLASLFKFVAAIYFLIWWAGLFYTITMYLLDTWVVTDHRILDNEQHGFFNRTLAEMGLMKLQDISVSVSGFIPTLLDYGDVEIQTAGTIPKFVLKQVLHPNKVRELIIEAHNQFIHEHKDGTEIHESTRI
jgi:uncharacterized membrane protein YdbT with pleckstrin-like domain